MYKIVLLICCLGFSSAFAVAEDKGKPDTAEPKAMEMTKEQREKMADAHENLAACLRSEKPITECREEMMKSCHENMGKEGCPMMGKHRFGKTHRHQM